MPFHFALPTTSAISLLPLFHSSSHPSLPLVTTTQRNLLREVLKRHKPLSYSPAAQGAHLNHVLSAVETYISYLRTLESGLSHSPSHNNLIVQPTRTPSEDVEHEMITEWRPTLFSFKNSSPTIPGRRRAASSRVELHGLQNEIAMALAVLGYTHSLLARQYLSSASYVGSSSSSPEDRTKAFQTATKHLLLSSGIHLHLASSVSHHSGGQRRSSESPELSISVQTALSELALAEATLLAVSKDDPYARAVAKELDPRNKEWMIKAPDLPKVRAHLFARLCIAAGEHLEKGIALLNTVAVGSISTTSSQGTTSFVSGIKGEDRTRKFETIKTKISPSLLKYMNHLRRTARAKACRFLAIDVELSGEVGKGIGWLKVAQMELFSSSSSAYDSVDEMTQKMVGLTNDDDDDDDDGKTTTKLKMKSFGKWKSEWNERRLDRKKMEKTVGESSKKMNDEAKTRGRRNRRRKNEEDDNDDDGRIEEGRIIRYLLTKWEKTNDTIHAQLIPHPTILLPTLPSGRNIHSIPSYTPPHLDPDVLRSLKGPPVPVSVSSNDRETGRTTSSLSSHSSFSSDDDDDDDDEMEGDELHDVNNDERSGYQRTVSKV